MEKSTEFEVLKSKIESIDAQLDKSIMDYNPCMNLETPNRAQDPIDEVSSIKLPIFLPQFSIVPPQLPNVSSQSLGVPPQSPLFLSLQFTDTFLNFNKGNQDVKQTAKGSSQNRKDPHLVPTNKINHSHNKKSHLFPLPPFCLEFMSMIYLL